MKALKYKDFYNVPGIYKITNIINGKFYIGSSVNLYNRNRGHHNKLVHGTHSNPKLQNSVNKYGIDNFTFEIVISGCDVSKLLILEGQYITKLNPEYNIDVVDINGKRTCSEHTKKLIGEKSKQKYIDKPELLEQQRQKMKNFGCWNKGLVNIYSEDTLKKMRDAGIKNSKKRTKESSVNFINAGKIAREKSKVKIIQYDLNMNLIKEWSSMAEAAKFYSAHNAGNIHTACKKGIKLYDSYWGVKK